MKQLYIVSSRGTAVEGLAKGAYALVVMLLLLLLLSLLLSLLFM